MLLMGACAFDTAGAGGGTDASFPPPPDAAVLPVPDARSVDALPPPAPDAPQATAFRKTITIAAGATTETLVDFPLYVALTADPDLRDRAQPDASDIFFVDADGVTALDYEIEQWDPATGSLVAWVRVPALAAGADTTLHLRYGDAYVAAPADPSGVWQSDFLAVFHMNDDPDGPIFDSTGARDGTAHPSMNASNRVAAQLGNGLALDGGNDVIAFENPYAGNAEHTISGWVSQQPSADNDAFIVLGTGGASNRSRFLHTRFFAGTIALGLYNDDRQTGENIQGDGFRLVHWTYTAAGQSRVYVDGALVDGPHTHADTADTQGDEGRIGNAPSGPGGFGTNMGLNGIVDEVRFAAGVRSAAWIAAEFANQSSPATFYAIGPEQPL